MNIKEIAELAGVSIGTVDRVLHNRGRVSQANVEKIIKIAKDGGYEPNNLASRLSSRQVFNFGVLIPELHSEFGYWQQIYKGIATVERELKNQQIHIVYSYYDRTKPDSFLEAAEYLFEKGIAAYIVAPLIPEMMRRVAQAHPEIPFVFIDSTLPELHPLANLSQNTDAAGMTGARMMGLVAPYIDKVFTLQTFSSAFNGRMRAECFAKYYSLMHADTEVENIALEDFPGLMECFVDIDRSKRYGMFVVNDGAHVVCDVLRKLDLLDIFTVIGFDLSPYNKAELVNGAISVILGQRPITQAHDAIMLLYKKYVLNLDEKTRECPVDIFLKENIPSCDHWL